MEVKNLQNEEASTSKKESLNISEDTLKTAKEKIFRLKKEAKKGKQNSKGKRSSLNGTVGKKKVTRRPIVYIGHLPHGFYEEELRSFFSQFGQVCRVKVSRSKKTGQSKGYAFVEFSDDDVARIAAETMNNYLMFERLLKTKYIPAQKVHQKMFPSKWITPESYPALERRNKILKKQEEKPTNEEVKKHRAKVLKSITRSLAVLQGLGINDYLPLVYDPPQNAAKEIQEETKVEACEASAAENTKIETNEDQVQEKAVPAAAENIGDVKPALGTPVVKKLTKATVKTPAKLPGTDWSEAVKTATPKVSKPTSAKTPAKPATSTSTESPKTVAEDAAKLAPVKTPARAPIASSTKTPARATEGNSVEATEVSKPDVAKTPAKVSKAQSTEPAIATPPASKTPGKPIGSDSTEAAKRTLISKATPAKTPGKPVVGIAKTPAKSTNNKAAPAASPKDAMVSESVTVTAEAKQPTPAKTPVGQVTASQSPIPTPDKSADKPTPAETSEQTSETASVGVAVEETPANAEEQVTETAAKPNPAKRALAKSDVSTPAKTPKKVATPKRTAREVAGKTPKKEIVSEATEKITEKMDVDDIPKAEVSDATKEESSKAQEATTPAKTPKKTPAKQIPKTDSKETPKVAGAEQKATPAKTSPMKRPAEVGEDASPAKVAAIRTPVSILKSPAGRVVVTPLSAEKADVVLTPKSPAITPPTRRLTRAAAKRMSLKISPKMDVVFSPRVTRKVAGTPSTPAGRRKSVKP